MNDINKDEIDARWHMLVWRMMIVICSISFVIAWILFGVYRVDKSIGAGAYIVKYRAADDSTGYSNHNLLFLYEAR